MKTVVLSISLILSITFNEVFTQPIPDTSYQVEISHPKYLAGAGPKILIDESHNNLHKKNGGLLVTSKLLEADGYNIESNARIITKEILESTDIYIIVNPLNNLNVGNWRLPTPSAFTDNEINDLYNWVKSGGKLLLVADHMPYGGAIHDLAAKFNIEWNNGFVMRKEQNWPPSTFLLENGTLRPSPVTTELMKDERLDKVISFTGSAFKVPESATPFMVFDSSHNIFMPEVAWQFEEDTETISADGWAQGAIMPFGEGKIIALGEAAMITAQLVNNNFKVGFNSPQAPQNKQLLLNIFHELSTK